MDVATEPDGCGAIDVHGQQELRLPLFESFVCPRRRELGRRGDGRERRRRAVDPERELPRRTRSELRKVRRR